MPADHVPAAALIATWQEALEAVVDLGSSLDAAQWAAPTPCPGWSVGDIVAHLVDIEQAVGGLPRPDHAIDPEAFPHIRNDVGRVTEIGVDARRGAAPEDVLQELRDVIAIRRAQLDALPEGEQVLGPFGNPTTLDRLLRIRTFDTWTHEQDIRTATGIDGDWDTGPARISLEQMLRGLPVIWTRTMSAPEGATLRVEVTGALEADVTVAAGPDGKGVVVTTADEPTVRLRCTWPDFMRLCCGRIDVEDPNLRGRITLDGDAALTGALLPALAMTP